MKNPESMPRSSADGKVQRKSDTKNLGDIRKRYPSLGNVLAANNEHNLIPTQAELDAR